MNGQMRENSYLSDEQIAHFKETLLAEKERICNKRAESEKYQMDRNELLDPLDEASINVQTSQDIRFSNRENFYLKKINKSLDLITRGHYGLCEECEEEIPLGRLKAMHFTRHCVKCKSDLEKLQAQTKRFEEERAYREIPLGAEEEDA